MERSKQEQSTNFKRSTKKKSQVVKKFDFKKAGADDEVMQVLYEMAMSGTNTTAAIFWAKARCGMNEKGRGKEQKVSQPPMIVIRTEEGKKA